MVSHHEDGQVILLAADVIKTAKVVCARVHACACDGEFFMDTWEEDVICVVNV